MCLGFPTYVFYMIVACDSIIVHYHALVVHYVVSFLGMSTKKVIYVDITPPRLVMVGLKITLVEECFFNILFVNFI